VLLALACTGAPLSDNPTVHINTLDQATPAASLIRPKAFGVGWTGGPTTPSKLTAPKCPGFNPKESDLVVTGHAEARFTYARAGVIFDQDSQVLESAAAVKTDFARTVTSKLPGCLAYQWKSSTKVNLVSVVVHPLALPPIGNISAAYRATVVFKTNTGRLAKIVNDYVFFAEGRLEFSLNVVAPADAGPQLAPFETGMAKILVKRAPTGNVA